MEITGDNQRLISLCEKYAGHVPRYTSYPTAVELAPCSDPAPVRCALAAASGSKKSCSLYVHLPHCHSLCYFCACNKIVSLSPDAKLDYLRALGRECEIIREQAGGPLRVCELHLGGGSPSYLSLDEIRTLHELLEANFEIEKGAERSIELDPRTMDEDKARLLASLGFKRASLGVQDFDEEVQRAVNRVQPYELTAETVRYLREHGFSGLNFDLIYGLPLQHPESFRKTLDLVLTLKPDRIALYGYAHVAWKAKAQNVFSRYKLPQPPERLALFLQGMEIFRSAGYEYIGLDHFALPDDPLALARQSGRMRRNFMGYTTQNGNSLAAIGLSAISDMEGSLYQNHTKLPEYQTALAAAALPAAKILQRSIEDRVRALIIERIMCGDCLKWDEIANGSADPELCSRVIKSHLTELSSFAGDGLIETGADGMQITALGRLFVRNIASVFDSYLSAHRQANSKTFSQSL